MRDFLMSSLTDEERGYAATLREDSALTAGDFIRSVFTEFGDPLLSADDLADLWGDGAEAHTFSDALDVLVGESFLEASEKTQRPFDAPGVKLFRRAEASASRLTMTALQSEDLNGSSRYQFSIEGRLVRGLARIDRLDALAGTGQQRDEIKAHVGRIREGVASGTHVPNPVLLVMLEESTQILDVLEEVGDDTPNSFVVIRPLEEFQEVVRDNGAVVQRSRIVEMSFPWRRAAFDEEKSVLLVDGQQRTAALSLIGVEDLAFIDLGVSAVVANDEEAKRVFQVANDSVKISTDFSKALLASMEEAPGYLKDEQITAEVVRLLALDDTDSPFYDIVKYPGSKAAGTVVVYNSVFGIVASFRRGLPEDLTGDAATLSAIVADGFRAVRDTWPDAWGLKPSESKLMHGAGLRAVTQVLVEKMQGYLTNGEDLGADETKAKLLASLGRLSTKVVWTDAAAAAGTATQKKHWREDISGRQNTNQDITALSGFLARESVALDMKAARGK
ncbi:DGQHR domain-containing protein [Nocardioides sp. SYSU D00065]|uniref:DGQHR domain-containing protein n=1 Tax=Nocardioides sp. SYSU D00065 TaxID=2817378 RepID=UPI001B320BC2|nr:DGQHR domain-containing protein [Nocardioides sp. SYSU D00065]